MATEEEPTTPSTPTEPDWVTTFPDWVADWNRAVDDWNDACRGRL